MKFLKILIVTLIILFTSLNWGSELLFSIEGFRNFIEYISDVIPTSIWLAVFVYGFWLMIRGIWGTVIGNSPECETKVEDVPAEWVQIIDNE